MSGTDLIRVARGLGLVLDRMVSLNKPGVVEKLGRAQFHLTELMKVAIDIRADMTTNANPVSVSRNTTEVSNPHLNVEIQKQNDIKIEKQNDIKIENFSVPETKCKINSDKPKGKPVLVADKAIHAVTPAVVMQVNVAPVISAPVLERETNVKPIESQEDLIGFESVAVDNANANNRIRLETTVNVKAMRERAVPATQLERMWGFGSLAARMAAGAVAESASRAITGQANSSRLSEENAERLAEALCRMRGAALKLGQMMSLQDDGMLSPALAKALDRVKQSADYMPKHQLERQLVDQLGSDWRLNLSEFEHVPIAAASIGQVHRAKLLDGTPIAMKIQYPGVADSIESDLNNLKRLIGLANVLPPGLFIDQIIKVARTELSMECDYLEEAASQTRYREYILNDPQLRRHTSVPEVFGDLSSQRVLTSRLVNGVAIDKAAMLPQKTRDAIARTMLILTLRELFEWRFIQSDPNFGNFLYDDPARMVNLIDFGASRGYPKRFVDGYMRLVWAAANKDRDTILKVSQDLGFLTGDETPEMMEAHIDTGMVFGEPFLSNEPYDFGQSSLTKRIGKYGDIFAKYRLTPPPSEAYSLHRKLAGAMLLSIKLKANIRCRDILEKTYSEYDFSTEQD